MRRVPLLAAAAALAVSAACGSDPRMRQPARGSLLTATPPPPVYPTPARWRYHPRSAAPLLSRLASRDGSSLFAGERGERWLVAPGRAPQAASQLAPEPLVSILRSGKVWLFVGASGTGYEAEEPLGPFVRSSAPVEPLARISAAGAAIAGVRRDGRLLRSLDAGATWHEVGPGEPRFVDVVLTKNGGFALSVPEQLWVSEDEAAHFKPLAVRPIGAFALAIDKSAGPVVRSMLGEHQLKPGPKPALERLGRGVDPERHELGAEPPRGPDAEAVAAGRAFFSAGDYFEVAERDKGRGFELWSGAAGAALSARALDRASGCRDVRLAGFGRHLALACGRRSTSRVGQTLELYASSDAGRTFRAEAYSVHGQLEELKLAVGAGGTLLITGTCAPHAASTGCSPAGVHRLDLDAPPDKKAPASAAPKSKTSANPLRPAATPALDGSALALAFSVDGTRAYLVGRRTKHGGLSLFVSHDGGRSFEARELEGLAADASEEGFRGITEADAAHDVDGLSAAEDGSVALIVRAGELRKLVVTDEDGRVVAVSRPPDGATLLGAAGSRALAVSTRTQSVWESLDGGASWDSVGRMPLDPCPDKSGCEVTIRCHAGGCAIGQPLSRLGWQGQAETEQALLPPPEVVVPEIADRKLRAGVACSLDDAAWRPLPGVSKAPSASAAAIGKTTWFAAAEDSARAAAWVLSVTAGERGAIETVTLLAPAGRADQYAYSVKPNVEGVAALRYVIPESRPGEARLLNLDVAWLNLLEGRLGRARLADGGGYEPGDYRKTGGGAQQARPDLLSIASGGVYMRIHQAAKDAQPTLFLDGRSVERVPPLHWPASDAQQQARDMIRVGNAHVPMLFAATGAAIVRARRDGGGDWAYEAFATGLWEPDALGLKQQQDIAYVAGRSGLHVQLFDEGSATGHGWLYPFRADGKLLDAPLAVPTQRHAGDRPARCSAEQIQKTPRVVVPYQAGTRHAVIVSDSVEPLRVLLTGAAVMYGTPEAPCVAAFDAHAVLSDGQGGSEFGQAILPLAELERSWLFRVAPDSDPDHPRIEARTMKCRFEPALEVPAEIFQAPGTSVRRSRR